MSKFNNDEAQKKRMEVYNSIDPAILSRPVNLSYPDGVKEIAELLTFLPEEKREATVRGYCAAMLNN